MIRTLIFDLGGVLLNLDYERTANAFRQLGLQHFDDIYTQKQQLGLFDAFDKGMLSPQAFREALRQHFPSPVSDAEIDTAWNAMLLDLPIERLDLLIELRQHYQLLLLSNTNEIHVTAFSAYLQQAHGFSDFSSHFDKWYYSCRMGMRKPDAEIFQRVLTENNLAAADTLFIDDSIQHVEGAMQVGIKSIWLEKGRTIHDLKREGVF